MTFLFQHVEGLWECELLSTDLLPSLNQFDYSIVCVMPWHCCPKPIEASKLFFSWILPSFWQNLMQYHCTYCVVLWKNENLMSADYTSSLTSRLPATALSPGRKSFRYKHEDILHLPNSGHLLCFICSYMKNQTWYFWTEDILNTPAPNQRVKWWQWAHSPFPAIICQLTLSQLFLN